MKACTYGSDTLRHELTNERQIEKDSNTVQTTTTKHKVPHKTLVSVIYSLNMLNETVIDERLVPQSQARVLTGAFETVGLQI